MIRLGVDRALGMLNFDGVAAAGSTDSLRHLEEISATLAPDDPINVQFTSGTTGSPKGAMLTHRNVKGARWLLLTNRASLRPGEDVTLDELFAANHALFVVYVLRDALKQLWRYRHPGYAAHAWRSWYRQAVRSWIQLLVRFDRRLKPYPPAILAQCRWPLGT